jgi:hypothetical protein
MKPTISDNKMESIIKLSFAGFLFINGLNSDSQNITEISNKTELSDSRLLSIHIAYDKRLAGLFESQKGMLVPNSKVYGRRFSGYSFTLFADYSTAHEINSKLVNYARVKVYDSPFSEADWNSGVEHIHKGTRSLVLDSN